MTLDFDSYSARILRASTSSVSWTIRAPNEETALVFFLVLGKFFCRGCFAEAFERPAVCFFFYSSRER